ncbi:MAG: hypothetical protein R3B13_22060 [Polyangiaceae bacterium]
MIWLIVALLLLDVCLALITLRLDLSFSAQARGEAEAWAAAGGLQLGPFTASAVAARGVPPRAELLAFGRRVGSLPRAQAKEEEETEPEDSTIDRAKRSLARGRRAADILERRFGLGEVLEFMLSERRRLAFRRCDLDLAYSFRDVILTGKLLAALNVLSGVVPPPIRIRQQPSWAWEDKLDASLAGTISIWPGRLLVDSLWFVVRKVRLGPRSNTVAEEGTKP